jgi:hypothetical protein
MLFVNCSSVTHWTDLQVEQWTHTELLLNESPQMQREFASRNPKPRILTTCIRGEDSRSRAATSASCLAEIPENEAGRNGTNPNNECRPGPWGFQASVKRGIRNIRTIYGLVSL